MTTARLFLWPAVLLAAVLLAGCANPVAVSVKGGSASDTEWRVGIPF
jgi:outer membrane murein-binding lipoprotein Lpp